MTDLARALELIDQAFDGVALPDSQHRTLYQAEAWDHYELCDQSQDHHGRWQDLPLQHLIDCPYALAHLDAQGMHYYLPALMTRYLEQQLRPELGEAVGWGFESLEFTLRPATYSEGGRAYQRERFSGFTLQQRQAVVAFLEQVASTPALNESWPELDEVRQAWARALAADEGWFERFNPAV